jgi:hypothetical protein
MPATFSPRATGRARAILAAIVASILLLPLIAMAWVRTPWARGEQVVTTQPVPFDHAVHVNGVAIDCRFCHAGADRTASAGMPTTQQCVTCHRARWLATPAFAAVRASISTGRPIPWQRVDQLPDFVYFEHAMHVRQGIACESCHGRVDQMSSITQVKPFTMNWCVECHRDPTPALRPRSAVTAMGWQRGTADSSGPLLMAAYRIKRLTDCTSCHR